MFDAEAFVEWMIGRGYSRKTIVCYRNSLLAADRWMVDHGHDLATVSATVVREYAESRPYTRSSRMAVRSSLSAFWSSTGRLDGPTRAVRIPKKRTMRCRALSERQAGVLATHAAARRDRKGLVVLLGLYAGLRRQEIATLRWSDLDAGWLHIIGKGDRERDVPLHPVLVDALADWREAQPRSRSGYVLPGLGGGGHQHPATVWGWVRDVAREAGLGDVATHVLRHTALATALDATGDLRAVQALAGHASPETTAGYTRATQRRLEAAVTALDYRVPA